MIQQETATNREYKSDMFTMIFSDKKELLQLYNAVSGRNYEDPELLEITTLKNAIYMSIKNDLSFIIEHRLSLYEHQSTYNPNMPLRILFYVADVYSGLTAEKNLYSKRQIRIPEPKFIVFYNGEEARPDREIMRLSDAYIEKSSDVSLDLQVLVLNINIGHNQELLRACKTLWDYSEYVRRIREHAKTMKIEEAVEKTITECIKEGILEEFLRKNRAEAKKMSIYEYDAEEHIRMEREESFEDGYKDGQNAERINTERERRRADEEKSRADEAESRADEAESRADEAERKVKELEAELAKLRSKEN